MNDMNKQLKTASIAVFILVVCGIILYFVLPNKKTWCAEYIEGDDSYVYHIDLNCDNIRHGVTTIGYFFDISLIGHGGEGYHGIIDGVDGAYVKYCNKCMTLDDIAACRDSIAKYNPQE